LRQDAKYTATSLHCPGTAQSGQNMMQETMISKDDDFGKHCLEIWQFCCFAIFFFPQKSFV
jgi:hypothetical protein